MRTNNIITKMKAGQMAYGCDVTTPSFAAIDMIAMAGFDYVGFDGQHGPFGPDNLDDMCRVAELNGLTPIARVPNIEASTILRFLDRGIMGIIAPLITTKEKTQQLAEVCRFAPLGKRSVGWPLPDRPIYRGGDSGKSSSSDREYQDAINSQILVVVQLESVEVLDDLDGILSVDGIDLYAGGPDDIAQSMGLFGQPDHPRVEEFEAQLTSAVHARGKKMWWDVQVSTSFPQMFLDGARSFIQAHKGERAQ
jgi:4-hydroxy-2-oxoheptanedioate aldolase